MTMTPATTATSASTSAPAVEALVVLGAGGDLTSRYLLPALARLDAAGELPSSMQILGVGTRSWSAEAFRSHAAVALDADPDAPAGQQRARFCDRLRYTQADATDPGALRTALTSHLPGRGPLAVYLALPHTLFPATARALAELNLPDGSRIVVEKPFGQDQDSARQLNALLAEAVPPEQIFRVDHFLAKQTVLNILGLRFANAVFEPLWNARYVECVDIVWDETLALEGRAGYYDRAGALQDMLQNHLLQLLCLVAMEAPAALTERDLRDRKVDVMRAIGALSPQQVDTDTTRGRYTAGTVNGQALPGYTQEAGVEASRDTETFATLTLYVGNARWAGVPFTLRSGKALRRDQQYIRVRFRPDAHQTFGPSQIPQANELVLAFNPDRIALSVNINGKDDPMALDAVELSTVLPANELPAYGQVLLDALSGDPARSIRGDEAEQAWRVIDPILSAWRTGRSPLQDYTAGSDGPPGSVAPPSRTPTGDLAW